MLALMCGLLFRETFYFSVGKGALASCVEERQEIPRARRIFDVRDRSRPARSRAISSCGSVQAPPEGPVVLAREVRLEQMRADVWRGCFSRADI
jgi:hypothetical protein